MNCAVQACYSCFHGVGEGRWERRNNYFVTLVRPLGLIMSELMPNFVAVKKWSVIPALARIAFQS